MTKVALLALVPYILVAGTPAKTTMKLPEDSPTMQRAGTRAEETISVVEAMVADPVERDVWERSLFGWEYWEASWQTSPKGWNDAGTACGVLQVHAPEKIIPGTTCEMMRKDSKLAIRVALTFLLEREKTCGSKAAAWTAFSWDGGCHDFSLDLVKFRCRSVGLTTSCESKKAALPASTSAVPTTVKPAPTASVKP
jgi:hypothetical protein